MQRTGLTQRLEEAKLRSAHFLCVTKSGCAAATVVLANSILQLTCERMHQQVSRNPALSHRCNHSSDLLTSAILYVSCEQLRETTCLGEADP